MKLFVPHWALLAVSTAVFASGCSSGSGGSTPPAPGKVAVLSCPEPAPAGVAMPAVEAKALRRASGGGTWVATSVSEYISGETQNPAPEVLAILDAASIAKLQAQQARKNQMTILIDATTVANGSATHSVACATQDPADRGRVQTIRAPQADEAANPRPRLARVGVGGSKVQYVSLRSPYEIDATTLALTSSIVTKLKAINGVETAFSATVVPEESKSTETLDQTADVKSYGPKLGSHMTFFKSADGKTMKIRVDYDPILEMEQLELLRPGTAPTSPNQPPAIALTVAYRMYSETTFALRAEPEKAPSSDGKTSKPN